MPWRRDYPGPQSETHGHRESLRWWRPALGWSWGVLLVTGACAGTDSTTAAPAAAAPAVADAASLQELQRINDELTTLGGQLGTIVAEHDKTEAGASDPALAQRVTDAESLFVKGKYVEASSILYPLVMDHRHANSPWYPKAVYCLAESLHHMGHHATAAQFFRETVTQDHGAYLEQAVRRLISIADRQHRWEGLENDVARLRQRGTLPPDIAYLYAKSLLRQGRPGEASTIAANVPTDHPLAVKARYLTAVAMTQLGDLDNAAGRFAELAGLPAGDFDLDAIRELAAMNHGRILFEQGKTTQAVDAYQDVPRYSPRFDQSIYEIVWTYIRAADRASDLDGRHRSYQSAIDALEVLLLCAADHPLASEAQLLLGQVLLRLHRYQDAAHVFTDLVQRFNPTFEAMRALPTHRVDPVVYLAEISGQRPAGSKALLPPVASRWVTGQEQLQTALDIAAALEESDQSLRDTDGTITSLLEVLDSDRRAMFFPALHQKGALAAENRQNLTDLSHRLLAVERALLKDRLPDDQRSELGRILAERIPLESKVLALPQHQQELAGRAAQKRDRLRNTELEVYRLRYDITGIQAQLNALRVWLAGREDKLNGAAEEEYGARMAQLELVASELQKIQQAVEADIRSEKETLQVAGIEQRVAEDLRRQYETTFEREREILSTVAAGHPLAGRLTALREAIVRYHVALGALEGQVGRLLAAQASDLRAELEREQEYLIRARISIADIRQQAAAAIQEATTISLNQVRDRLQNVVVRADLGLVDIAWQLKEEQTQEINRRISDQRRDLQILDGEYADVLAEE